MDDLWRASLWRQFGAAIDMLENAITACPDELWGDRSERPEYWYVAFHTLFFLDLYLSEGVEGFRPPEPFGLEEMDPAGVMPPRVYSKAELLGYLEHGREKCRGAIGTLTDEKAREHRADFVGGIGFLELIVDNMRHVQHHTAQLNLILRQKIDSAPAYVSKTMRPL